MTEPSLVRAPLSLFIMLAGFELVVLLEPLYDVKRLPFTGDADALFSELAEVSMVLDAGCRPGFC